MRAQQFIVVAALAASAGVTSVAEAAPPPCGGAPQISDALGDGHHNNTDVTAAWLSEAAGRLQAVIQVRQAVWEPAHDDSDAAGFAYLYESGGQIRYVRAEAPRQAPVRYDQGTWTRAGGFASAGATTGETTAGSGGTVTLDVPGLAPPALLTRSFVLTYDGITGTEPHWVDRAPGGVVPEGSEYGADFTVGSCSAAPPGTPPPAGAVKTTAVALSAPKRRVGSGTTRVTGRITPARAGVAVELTATARRAVTRRATTGADGTFAVSVPLSETTRLRAVAEGIGSQTRTVTVVSKVTITVKRTAGGGAMVSGRVSPALPGRVLWLRTNAVRSSAKTTARKGRFTLRLKHPRPGRYQAVFIPSGNRAERSTSKSGVIR